MLQCDFAGLHAAALFFCLFACRPVSAGTCSLSRAGSAWRRLLYVTQSTCQVEPAEGGKLSRESSQSLDLVSSARCSTTQRERAPEQDKGRVTRETKGKGRKKSVMIIRLSNGEYPFISPSTHRDSAALLAVAPLQGPGTYCTVYLPT